MITLEIDDDDFHRGLGRLLKNATNARPMMRAIATEMTSITEDNFERESFGSDRWEKSQRATDENGKRCKSAASSPLPSPAGWAMILPALAAIKNTPPSIIWAAKPKPIKSARRRKKPSPSAAWCSNRLTIRAAIFRHAVICRLRAATSCNRARRSACWILRWMLWPKACNLLQGCEHRSGANA